MEIRIKKGKNGALRAYRYEMFQMRWFPISMKLAQEKLARGEAFLEESENAQKISVPKDPIWLDEKGAIIDEFALFQMSGNA